MRAPERGAGLAGRIRAVLISKDITLHQAAKESEHLYGHTSRYRVPHNLYHRLTGSSRLTPSLEQLCALSRVTGYALNDWLLLCGIDLQRIPQLQAILSAKRTILLDSSFDINHSAMQLLNDLPGGSIPSGIVPLGHLLEMTAKRRQNPLEARKAHECFYAMVGLEDALAFPDLLPGSIVCVNPRVPIEFSHNSEQAPERIFLIEHSEGIWCSRLLFLEKNRVRLISKQLAYAHVELRIPDQAQIIGVVDLEIRWLSRFEQPRVPKEFAAQWKPQTLCPCDGKLGRFLQRQRARAGLSFREASALSRRIATLLGDERYYTALGSLSDYEAETIPPRQLQKAITLCILYGIPFSHFLMRMGVRTEQLGRSPIPVSLMANGSIDGNPVADMDEPDRNPTLSSMTTLFGDVPFFLGGCLADLSGIREPSLRDFFWVCPGSDLQYSHSRGTLLVLVNRRRKKPVRLRSAPPWQQPVYLLRTREGTYFCTCCSLENGVLMLYPETQSNTSPVQLRNHQDAEVVGQVMAVARRLSD
jgi:hypothetical protein